MQFKATHAIYRNGRRIEVMGINQAGHIDLFTREEWETSDFAEWSLRNLDLYYKNLPANNQFQNVKIYELED